MPNFGAIMTLSGHWLLTATAKLSRFSGVTGFASHVPVVRKFLQSNPVCGDVFPLERTKFLSVLKDPVPRPWLPAILDDGVKVVSCRINRPVEDSSQCAVHLREGLYVMVPIRPEMGALLVLVHTAVQNNKPFRSTTGRGSWKRSETAFHIYTLESAAASLMRLSADLSASTN